MTHTADYGQVQYRPMILQYSEILQYHFLIFKTSVYGTLTAAILRSMLGLCCDETYEAMTNYDDTDDNGDNGGNEDGKTMTIPLPDQDPMVRSSIRSRCLGLAEEDRATTATALRPRRTMYLHVRLYIYPIKIILKMCHKLLYAKIGALDLCCRNTKKNC